MRKIISKNDRWKFFSLSRYILISYIVMVCISFVSTLMNYFSTTKTTAVFKIVALIFSTIHSLLIVVNYFAIKAQKGRVDYVKNSTFAYILVLVMDVLSTINIVCNTITSLINGDVVVPRPGLNSLLPIIAFISFAIAVFNLCVAIYLVVVSKKSYEQNKTL